MLFAKAITKGDLRTARLVQRDLTELLGLAALKRPDIDLGGSTAEAADEFRALVWAKAARLAQEAGGG